MQITNPKIVYKFICDNTKQAFKDSSSIQIFQDVLVYQVKPKVYGLARAEGTFPLSIHNTIPEVIKAALLRFQEDIAISDILETGIDYFNDEITIEHNGDIYSTTITELIAVAEDTSDKREGFKIIDEQ